MAERILVVDDERDAADSLVRLIEILGHEALACYDGEAALQAVASFTPDMALIDIGMPGLNGFETVSRIRQQRGNVYIILVAVTGWTRDEDQKRAYDAGFDLHIAKPMTVDTLRELLTILDPESGAD